MAQRQLSSRRLKEPPAGASRKKPYCFVSYSTREPHVEVLIECLSFLFGPYYEIKRTPSALVSGASQREKIEQLIAGCAFGVVALDGLRPNVVFEYGMLQATGRPVILLKEANAEVDVKGYLRDPAGSAVKDTIPINLDAHFSNVKDVYYVEWNRFSVYKTIKTIWEEYRKRKDGKDRIVPHFDIREPKPWA